MTTQPDFRAAVAEAMARRGLNAKQLSDQSGVGYASVYDFVRGGGMTADNLAKVCGALGISVKIPKAKRSNNGANDSHA